MLISIAVILSSVLLQTASARLVRLGDLPRPVRIGHHAISVERAESDPALEIRDSKSPSPFKAGQHTSKRQNDTLCNTNGGRQWTGTVDVTDHRRLFYWFFESRGNPKKDPIVLWINGGPGESSMYGALTEMGACTLMPGTNTTEPNPWSWNNNASVLFLEQPAGAGLSQVSDEDHLSTGDEDAAEDFQTFLNIFFTKLFPQRAHLPIHFAAESYGGHYAPTYVKHILDARRYGSKNAFKGNITSMIIVNGLVDLPATALGAYELLCESDRGKGILNATACDAMREIFPECWRQRQACLATDDPILCYGAATYCQKWQPFYDASGRDLYDIRHICSDAACADPVQGNITAYFRQPSVLSALGLPEDFVFLDANWVLGGKYWSAGYFEGYSYYRSMLSDIASVLDAHQTQENAPIRLLVLNGNDDFICNTPGNKMAYDEVRWSGQAEYRAARWAALPEHFKGTGEWKGTRDRKLVFVGIDEAGHEVPRFQREASYRILMSWMSGWRD
ncbi:hypothetical protein ACCO45_009054 [Purpureocillium lilacinum]|uniref:Uncharacterized protein n=1 Tax=Purpureocillium lilacinum TaxID=33203 RepID=A0ACC4DJN3_PURLI